MEDSSQSRDESSEQLSQDDGGTADVIDQLAAQTADPPTISVQQGEKLPDTVEGRILKSQELKEDGNSLFKQQEWKKAIRRYHHSLMYAKGITDRGDKLLGGLDVLQTVLKPTKEQETEAEELLVSLHNNITACLIKVGEWDKAIPHADKVLKLRPGNHKALFRKGMSCLNTGRLDEAKKLLTKAREIDPKDANIRRQLDILKREEDMYLKSEKKLYGAMFAQTK